jgi:hypothetical protein
MFDGELTDYIYYIMLKNKQIYHLEEYGRRVESFIISSVDAFVFIDIWDYYKDESYSRPFEYLFPLMDSLRRSGILKSYLAKLGFYCIEYLIYPATGLEYYAVVRLFSDRLVIEIADIDTVVTNTGLRKIVIDVLGKRILTQKKSRKEISQELIERLETKLEKQKPYAGHSWYKVHDIIIDYYIDNNTSLAKEVLAITNAYNRIFEPYRVVYDTGTRQQVLM